MGTEHLSSALSPDGSVPWQSFPGSGGDDRTFVGTDPGQENKRLCGLPRRVFIILAAILGVAVVAAAVGGGVGGAVAARQRSSDASESSPAAVSSATNSSSSTPTRTTTTSSSSTSSAPTATVSFLNNQTDPSVFKHGFAFQAWEKPYMKGNFTPIYSDEGFINLPFNATSYIWLEDKSQSCCVTFCNDTKPSESYWCQSRWRNSSSGYFRRISLWCGDRDDEQLRTSCS
ncbi:47f2ebbb-d762-4aa3-a1fc-8961e4424378 [Thermothielavioides terrestris]|uniref:47f2ebbb-d762-4aa3-a1fc-8961e4424378 n=1 Tax=Thermothielavioides terrestris TaxID=2587410 RepID=A0A3S4D5W2_9PEZI|nr:47f2ebbb-d762-4aa3-a1fc-8961e4424378 [Thermothielavioides terrestris]